MIIFRSSMKMNYIKKNITMKKYGTLIILVSLALLSFKTVHKHYLSLTQLKYVEETKSLQVTTDLFVDDLEMVLRQRYSDDIRLVEGKTDTVAENSIKNYLNDKLVIWINGGKIDLNFLGYEYKQDKIVCYLEAENVPEISTFDVSNEVLLDLFPEQQNVVKLKINDLEKSFLLIRDSSKEHLELK
ncbi:hypothetical protein SAMN03097699_1981 [Flavobacteriaceae bacterium MAR_2010_188]|nr:hypothetical protein SAMN03097699_1981 [Flavobacteriaceae bacterium MAR_2010_188]